MNFLQYLSGWFAPDVLERVFQDIKAFMTQRYIMHCKSIVLVLQSCITNIFLKVNAHYKFYAEGICHAFIRVRYLVLQFIYIDVKQMSFVARRCDKLPQQITNTVSGANLAAAGAVASGAAKMATDKAKNAAAL